MITSLEFGMDKGRPGYIDDGKESGKDDDDDDDEQDIASSPSDPGSSHSLATETIILQSLPLIRRWPPY